MALKVEDGTGKPDANALTSRDEALKYWLERGRAHADIAGYSLGPMGGLNSRDPADAAKDARVDEAIIRASFYLSESFHWNGRRTFGRNSTRDGEERFQALSWPRYGVYDREGAYVPSSGEGSIPRALKWATAEVAFYELENPHGLQPVYQQNKTIEMVKAGSASVKFDTGKVNAAGARPRLLVIMDLIGEFVAVGAGNSMVGTAVRG